VGRSRPNIIFLVTHDVGPVYGAYGNRQISTPNVDALAGESVRFDSHYCQWPLCGPSRANLFTGCRPLTTGRFNNQPFFAPYRSTAPPDFTSLPEYFVRNGYASRGFGWVYHDDVDPPSWSLGHEIPAPNPGPVPSWAEGYLDADYLFEWKNPASREVIRERLEAVKGEGITPEEFQDREVFRRARGPAIESADVDDSEYYDGKVAEGACKFLRSYGGGGVKGESGLPPYFLGVGFVAPHTPFRAPARYWDRYDAGAFTLPANREWPAGSAEWMAGDSEPAQYYTTHGYTRPWRPNEAQLRELLHGHYATISYIDALIGRIIAAARERGDWENTVVVFTSDHGFSEGQHGYWGKHNMWDASLHVPLFVRTAGKDGDAGDGGHARSVERVTEHVDVFPTVCDLAGLPVPAQCEGASLLPLLRDQGGSWKDVALSHRKHMWHDRLQVYDFCHSIRTPQHRYTEYRDADGSVIGAELFDYEDDPLETANMADLPERAALRRALAGQLRDAVEASGAG
jgi:arylsulfatase A-like enzyme